MLQTISFHLLFAELLGLCWNHDVLRLRMKTRVGAPLSSGAVVFRDVPALDHEVGDQAMEGAALVSEPEFPRAKCPEKKSHFTPNFSRNFFFILLNLAFIVHYSSIFIPEILCRLRRHVVVELEVYSAKGLPVHRHVHEAQLPGV